MSWFAGVLDILDQATNDLASLIGRLDLEATPGRSVPNTPATASTFNFPPTLPREFLELQHQKSFSPLRVTKRERQSPVRRATITSESPSKANKAAYQAHTVRGSMTSITSLRPYAQSRSRDQATLREKSSIRIGRQIAPWPISPSMPEPSKDSAPVQGQGERRRQLMHQRTFSGPEPDTPPVFRPLRPASKPPSGARPSLLPILTESIGGLEVEKAMSTPPLSSERSKQSIPSSVTFGSSRKPSKLAEEGELEEKEDEPSPIPVFRRRTRTMSRDKLGGFSPMVLTLDTNDDSLMSLRPLSTRATNNAKADQSFGVPISPAARRGLGLAGTLGDSDSDNEQDLSEEDPDSDIPDELQAILSTDNTMTFQGHLALRPSSEYAEEVEGNAMDESMTSTQTSTSALPSPGPAPASPLPTPDTSDASVIVPDVPVFRASLITNDDEEIELNDSDYTASPTQDQDRTERSFDFTGELRGLNESGGSNRKSFVEQLEIAFKTPAKFELDRFGRFKEGESVGSEGEGPPPVPKLDESMMSRQVGVAVEDDSFVSGSRHMSLDVPKSVKEWSTFRFSTDEGYADSQEGNISAPVDLLPSVEIFSNNVTNTTRPRRGTESSVASRKSKSSTKSKASDGQLDVNFKFGGRRSSSPEPPVPAPVKKQPFPLTLSDIIPPPELARSISLTSVSGGNDSRSTIEEDSSVLKSIFAKAADVHGHSTTEENVPPAPPAPRRRLQST